ncbi:hypothetical protein Tco_0716997 [Tanacetum coccineum]
MSQFLQEIKLMMMQFVDDVGKKNDAQYPAKDGDKNGHEKDVRNQKEALRKQFDQETKRLVDQGEASITNSTNRLNTVSLYVSVARQSFDNNDLPTDPLMPDLEDSTGIFRGAYDDEDVGAEADLNNFYSNKKNDQFSEENAMVSYISKQRRTNHKDYQNSLFACFLSQIEPKKVIQVLTDPSWIEAIRFQVTPKMSHLHAMKRIFRYLKGQPKLGLWYPRDSPFDLEVFSDSDYARASLDMKSIIGAEYVGAANCCGQVLWIQNQMLDYGFNFMNTKIYIDNESTICIVKNPVFHSKTKHIEIRYHFIRDSYEKKLIQSSRPINLVADETVYKEWEDIMERAATTASSLDAEQDSDAQTRFETTFKKSNDPPLSRGYTLGSGEDSMKLLELMELCTKLSDLVSKKKREMSSPFWNEIEVNAGNSNLMLLALVTAAGLLTTVRHNLVLPVQVNTAEGDSINTSIQAKAKTVNGERQLQALVDKKKVIITETSIRSDLHLEDAGGTDCLPTATIFEELARMGAKTTAWNEFSSTMASAIICLATNQKFNLSKYIFDAMSRRKQKKTTAVPHPSDSTADVPNEESVPTHSNDPLLSGEDRLKLTDLMDMCTKLSERVLDLEHTKTAQAQEITNLKLRVKKLEKKAGLRTHKFKRLYKVGVTRRVEYSDDESLGAQEDASNQGRSIEDIDKDAEVSLVDETQGRSDDAEMFDTDALIGNEVFAKNDMIEKDQDVIPKEVSTAAPSTTVVPPPDITKVEITLAQTLAKLKSAKSKVVIQEPVQSTATTAPSTIPKAKGITFRDAGESTTRTPTSVSSSSIKDKGKAKMDEPKVPLKKKDQIALDEEMARNLKAQIQAKLIEERLARKKEEEANIALIESWDNT